MKKAWWIGGAAAVVLILIAVIFRVAGMGSTFDKPVQPGAASAQSGVDQNIPAQSTTPDEQALKAQKELQQQQLEAEQRLAQMGVVKPLEGNIAKRPEFVSPFEWNLLTQVASADDQNPQALNRLVNLLRFNKLLERWERLHAQNSPADAEIRSALAKQLLAELPGFVEAGDFPSTGVDSLRQALQADAAL